MNSEKVKEIKKALKYCCAECDCDCPFYKNGKSYEECKSLLLFEALTLINELESENERLLNEKWNCQDDLDNYHEENKQLKDRITELEKEVETRKEEVLHLQEYGKKLIRETELKQFAERLKEKMLVHYPTVVRAIDETLKEVINE